MTPSGQEPVPTGQQVNPGAVLPGNPREPLLQDVSLQDVHVQSAALVKPTQDWRTIISAASAPLLLVRDGDQRSALLTFDVHHSDLPLRAAFPILVQNLLSYLLPGGFENQAFAPDQPVTLEGGAGDGIAAVALVDLVGAVGHDRVRRRMLTRTHREGPGDLQRITLLSNQERDLGRLMLRGRLLLGVRRLLSPSLV